MPKGIYRNPVERAAKIAASHRRGAFFTCLVCDTQFWRKPCAIKKGDNKFCSRQCYLTWQRGRKRDTGFRQRCSAGQHRRHSGRLLITPIHKRIRGSLEFRQWRESVFKRDNWTCQKCGKRSKKNAWLIIHAHHVKPFAIFPELRFIVDNGQTLCKDCHDKEPKGKEVYLVDNATRI